MNGPSPEGRGITPKGRGTAYGLGVGPGDPELITVKAARILRQCPVLAYPAPEGGDSLVREIVDSLLPGTQTEIPIRMPMTVSRFPAREVYDRATAEIGAHLDAGRDTAIICEGDPFFYGSFMYLFERLTTDYEIEVVPGVSSLFACATALEFPLASRNDVLTIIPAPLDERILAARLAGTDAAAIIKIGRHFAKVRRVLESLGLGESARYIERASMAAQRILPLGEVAPDAAPYMSMILVHHRGESWK